MPSNHLILCHPLLLLPSIFPSIRIFSNDSILCIKWPKYWSFSFNISLSNEYSGLISFRMDWLDLLAVQGSLNSPTVQKHQFFSSAFVMVQLLHLYMTTGKTIALIIWTFELQRNDAFKLWCWKRLLRVPWTARRSKQSMLKEISPEYSLEGLMLKLKLQYFGHLMQRTDSLDNTRCWERWRAGGEGDDRG